jgi:two-component system NtrC family sensor kinase
MRAHATKIKIQALRTKNLVGNLLKFARQGNTEKKLLSLNTVAENSVRLKEMEQAGKSLQYIRDLQNDLPFVWGDSVQLTDVSLQLMGNAADMVPETGGIIRVRTYKEGGYVTLEVSDNGPGMSDPTRVFDPFYTTKALGKGTGLGLSVCYGIVSGHKGEIVAENDPQGGARFKVRLPEANSQMGAPASVQSAQQK